MTSEFTPRFFERIKAAYCGTPATGANTARVNWLSLLLAVAALSLPVTVGAEDIPLITTDIVINDSNFDDIELTPINGTNVDPLLQSQLDIDEYTFGCNIVDPDQPSTEICVLEQSLADLAFGENLVVGTLGDFLFRSIVRNQLSPAWNDLETNAKALVAAQLGVSNGDILVGTARAEIRAAMFLRLLQIIDKPAAGRSVVEQSLYDSLLAAVKTRRQLVANLAKAQYNQWNNAPCAYQVPVGDDPGEYLNRTGVKAICLSQIGSIFTAPSPPSALEFTTWANRLVADAQLDAWVNALQLITKEEVNAEYADVIRSTTRALSFHAAFGNGVASGELTLEFDSSAADPTQASLEARQLVTEFAGAYTRDFLLMTFGPVLFSQAAVPDLWDIAAIFVVGSALEVWKAIDVAQVGERLDASVATANATTLEALYATPEGRTELLLMFTAQTIPDYEESRLNLLNSTLTPGAPQDATLKFRRYDGNGNLIDNPDTVEISDPIDVDLATPLANDPVHEYYLGGNWLAQRREGVLRPNYVSHINYQGWDDAYWSAWLIDDEFFHVRNAVPLPGEVTTEVYPLNQCPGMPPYNLNGYFDEGIRCVRGFGTNFTSTLAAGDRIRIGNRFNTVREVRSDTALVLENEYLGPGSGGGLALKLYRVDTPDGDCLATGACYSSDAIEYRLRTFNGQLNPENFRIEIGGNKAPVISPAITSQPLVVTTFESWPILGTTIPLPTVRVGYPEGRLLNFVANARDPDSDDPLTYDWTFVACDPGPLCVGNNAEDYQISGSGKESVEYSYFHHGDYQVTLTVTDAEGASASATLAVKILDSDKTPPILGVAIAGIPVNDWYSQPARINWTISDPESPIYFIEGCRPLENAVQGINEVPCEARSSGGTIIYDVVIKVDNIAPQATITSPAADAVYLLDEVIAAAWQVTDEPADVASGVDEASATSANGAPIPTAEIGFHFFQVHARDLAGNLSLTLQRYEVVTVAEATENLVETVELAQLQANLAHRFSQRLQKVIRFLEKGKESKADKELDKFIRDVRKQLGKGLDPDLADSLIAEAERLKQ